MKKTTIVCSLLFLGMTVIAQTGKMNHKFAEAKLSHSAALSKNTNSSQIVKKGSAPMKSVMSTIWSDDFSVPAHWTKSSPTGAGLWTIGTAAPGCPPYNIPPIASTSAANGFGMFDSNCDCSTNEVADITTASAINCSAAPFVNLNFQQQYRRFYDSTFVYVSNNGTTWTKYPVNVALPINSSTATNPDMVKINISATAGGQGTVWIRFEFYSPSSLGSSAGCGYAWMIDDVSITTMSPNDIGIDRAYADFSYVDGGYYTKTPVSQIVPIMFRSAISNQGSSAQTNSKLNVNISDGVSSVYNQNSPVFPSLAYTAVDTLLLTTPAFTPVNVVKNYTATFNVSQTEVELAADLPNNTVVKTFAVTDTVYARDNGTATGLASPNEYTGGDVDDARIGLIYEFPAAATASSITAYLDTTSGIGTNVQAKIYSVVSTVFTEVAASAVMTISSPASGWVNFPLPTTALIAGTTYVAAIVTTGVSTGPPNLYVILGSDNVTEQPNGIALVYLPGATTPNWYTVSSLPMIRLNVKSAPAGITELNANGVKLSQNMPNPTNGVSLINYELEKNAQVSLNVYDITGKVIAIQNMGNQIAGSHSTKFDSNNLSAGVYYYSLTVNNTTTPSMKMVVIK